MGRNNKQFVLTMITVAVIGLTVLMLAMFLGIKAMTPKGFVNTPHDQEEKKVEEKEEIKHSLIKVVVEDINGDEITVLDIEQGQRIIKKISLDVDVKNEYDGIMPLSAIEKGDLAEIVYEPYKDIIIEIRKSKEAWQKSNIDSSKMNASSHTFTIGEKKYHYTEDVFVLDEKGEKINTSLIGSSDKLQLKGLEDKIWSIVILEKQATLTLGKLPIYEGTLEINRNTMLPIEQISEPVPIPIGKNKVVIQLKGYKPVIKEINAEPGENYELTLEDAVKAMTRLKILVNNPSAEYYVIINKKTYSWNQTIELEEGTYGVEVIAEGFKPWRGQVDLKGDIYNLKVNLQLVNEETTESQADTNNQTSSSGTVAPSDNTGTLHTVNIATEPKGAAVYIGAIKQGETPLIMKLPKGTYALTLVKEGYQAYSTSIIVDDSGSPNNYLYMLSPSLQ